MLSEAFGAKDKVHTKPIPAFRVQGLQLLYRNMQQFRGGLVFKAHRLWWHSTLGLIVTKKESAIPLQGIGAVSSIIEGKVPITVWAISFLGNTPSDGILNPEPWTLRQGLGTSVELVQVYLAHIQQRPSRTLQEEYA